jgi:hypothetical protein
MKNLFLIFGLVTLLSFKISAANGRDTISMIKVKGSINNASNCKIELLCANKVIDSLQLQNGRKKFSFQLKANSYYALRISRPGYVTRLVSVDTRCPSEIVDQFAFHFSTELFTTEEAESLNKDALDFPIAVIHFDGRSEQFIHNRQYTTEIKKDIYAQQNSEEKLVSREGR